MIDERQEAWLTEQQERMAQELVDSPIDNPYWEALRASGTGTSMWALDERLVFSRWDRIGEAYKSILQRDEATVKWAWAIPDPKTLDFIHAHLEGRKVVDMGAGTGYWAWMLSQMGVDVAAYDLHPPREGENTYHSKVPDHLEEHANVQWYDVQQGDHRKLRLLSNRDRVLLLSWPPYDKPMGYEALKSFKGDTVIYIGEGSGGCTGDRDFHDLLGREWDEIDYFPIARWEGVRDYASIYDRKPKRKKVLP